MPRSPLLLLLGAALLPAAAATQTPDSILAVSYQGQSRFRLNVDGGAVWGGNWDGDVLGVGIPASGAGTRMMWYPRNGAFRAGRVTGTEWNAASVGSYSTALGYNTTASGSVSTAMGSFTTASGEQSTAMGWSTMASGANSTAMGSFTAASGARSTAMGYSASTNGHSGSFVHGDGSTTTVMNADAANQFSVRAAGGYRLFTNSSLTAGVTLASGGSAWDVVSDRARKEHFLSVDGEDVLARIRTLPLATWRYIAEEDRSVRHMGPMAQDWHRAFGFSSDSLTINSGDLDGVNLAGVQALESRTAALREENRALREENARQEADLRSVREESARQEADLRSVREENAALRTRLERVEALLTRLAAP
jgi:hypothetical protein